LIGHLDHNPGFAAAISQFLGNRPSNTAILLSAYANKSLSIAIAFQYH
jgi:hypothetical protein